jgi:thymidine kinase
MSIELIVGPMFAGKTKELLYRIRQLKRNPQNRVVCITHTWDDRYSQEGKIVSHEGDSHPAIPLQSLLPFVSDHRYMDATHIVIEEAQFFGDLHKFATQSADAHKKGIVCAGLDGDFQRNPFGHLVELLPHCDSIIKLRANCPSCSETGTAIFTARMRDKGSDQVYIGGKEVYRPMCRKHYIEYRQVPI